MNVFLTFILLVSSSYVSAQTDCRSTRAQVVSKVIVNYLDNVTTGKINTMIGVSYAGIAALGSSLFGNSPDVEMTKNKDQVSLAADIGGISAVSLGLVQVVTNRNAINDNVDGVILEDHETGHSYQSGVLGKWYIPVALINYIPYVLNKSWSKDYFQVFTEQWANAEAHLLDHSCGGVDLHISGGQIDFAGKTSNVINLRFALSDSGEVESKNAQRDLTLKLVKSYEWLKTDVLLPKDTSVFGSEYRFALLEKNMKVSKRVIKNNDTDYNLVISSQQTYGAIENDRVLKRTTMTALEGVLSGGVGIKRGDVQVEVTIGKGQSLVQTSGDFKDQGQENSFVNSQSVSYKNRLQVNRSQEKKNLLDGSKLNTTSVGVTVKATSRIAIKAGQETKQYDTSTGQKKKKKQLTLGGSITM